MLNARLLAKTGNEGLMELGVVLDRAACKAKRSGKVGLVLESKNHSGEELLEALTRVERAHTKMGVLPNILINYEQFLCHQKDLLTGQQF